MFDRPLSSSIPSQQTGIFWKHHRLYSSLTCSRIGRFGSLAADERDRFFGDVDDLEDVVGFSEGGDGDGVAWGGGAVGFVDGWIGEAGEVDCFNMESGVEECKKVLTA